MLTQSSFECQAICQILLHKDLAVLEGAGERKQESMRDFNICRMIKWQ